MASRFATFLYNTPSLSPSARPRESSSTLASTTTGLAIGAPAHRGRGGIADRDLRGAWRGVERRWTRRDRGC
ncbi:hypothetical protein CC85DRAFT_285875 [Cutaneotrichosporon oleaginosum]|uniref:Uncharacterized protein n=1 Tax=Cutaneotrichosporon oleaginosum TaxID=879819 RepID=A0A0J0XLW4_9TREE|nr:uncharacterized protein CC85DRAFT_285875 [Cutaneotrichosporon oleaginosum]KLT42106.1 hypothetical protein CC85DRAFT_285875 [Cutaneotrichosporon oleaginosum]TXT04655.1 hypothetical protein COLE_07474 [Cutaneotrichosporon oleaginosum]